MQFLLSPSEYFLLSDSGERIVTVSDLAVSYNSTNGRTAVFTLPAQTITVTYENTLGAVINLTIENDQADSFSITRDGIAYSDLNEKLLALIGKIDSSCAQRRPAVLVSTRFYRQEYVTSDGFWAPAIQTQMDHV